MIHYATGRSSEVSVIITTINNSQILAMGYWNGQKAVLPFQEHFMLYKKGGHSMWYSRDRMNQYGSGETHENTLAAEVLSVSLNVAMKQKLEHL